MSSKKSHLEYVRAWLDALSNPVTTEQKQAQLTRQMIKTVLPEYNAKLVTVNRNTTKRVRSES